MSKFIKDIFSVGVSKVIILLTDIVTSVIVARSLGPTANGIISSLIVYPSLLCL